jgi:hypothetical protein
MNPKVKKALDLIQHAQSVIGEAAQELCSVDGFADEWTSVNRLYDIVKQEWHTVNNRRIQTCSEEMGQPGQPW